MKSLVAIAVISGLSVLIAISVEASEAEAAYLCRSDELRLVMSVPPDHERATACTKADWPG